MNRMLRRGALTFAFSAICGLVLAQEADQPRPRLTDGAAADVRLPNGKSQRDELVQELREALEKEDRFVFSLSTVKKTEDIEKLAHKIRTRMRHD
jgi:hypothetical protein